MDKMIPYDPKTDLRELRFNQSPTGHVHSPWFTYDYTGDLVAGRMTYGWGYGRYAAVMHCAKTSFAALLDMPEREVIVTELPPKPDGPSGLITWRLSTTKPHQLPAPRRPTLPKPEPKDEVIDIVATPVAPRPP